MSYDPTKGPSGRPWPASEPVLVFGCREQHAEYRRRFPNDDGVHTSYDDWLNYFDEYRIKKTAAREPFVPVEYEEDVFSAWRKAREPDTDEGKALELFIREVARHMIAGTNFIIPVEKLQS